MRKRYTVSKMADLKMKNMLHLKGQKVPVTIDDALEDMLVVSLEINSKMYRGILLDMKKRNLPHGIPLSKFQHDDDNNQNATSATTLRHTYNQQTSNQAPSIPYPVALSRHFNGGRSARSIRLRPRQTLCSQCKSSCTETDKGMVPVIPILKQPKPPDPQVNKRLKETLRKRPAQTQRFMDHNFNSKSTQSMLTSHSIHTRLTRSNSSTDKRSNRYDKNSHLDTRSRSGSSASTNGKATPLIRISIGEKTVLKIPPRSHGDEVDGECQDGSNQRVKVESEGSEFSDKNVTYSEDDGCPVNKKARKALRKEKDKYETENSDLTNSQRSLTLVSSSSHHKKHKRKHKHRHMQTLTAVSNQKETNIHDILDVCDENIELTEQDELQMPTNNEVYPPPPPLTVSRPRLLYTWRQNKGLSPRQDPNYGVSPKHDFTKGVSPRHMSPSPMHYSNYGNIGVPMSSQGRPVPVSPQRNYMSPRKNSSPQRLAFPSPQQMGKSEEIVSLQPQKKEYRLRSRERHSTSSRDSAMNDTESSLSCDEDLDSDSMVAEGISITRNVANPNSEDDQSAQSEDCSDLDDAREGPPGDNNMDIRPVMLKIHQEHLSKCVAPDGRTIHVGDIVWGKIKGFPWWPGRVLSINVTQQGNSVMVRQLAHVSWFGSSTMSHIQCSDLFPFLENFKIRYNRKKRGTYKVAIKQATIAAQSITNTHHIDFTEYDL